jgi:anti-sigma regulatory factor (Ser/Thr protein kinase)
MIAMALRRRLGALVLPRSPAGPPRTLHVDSLPAPPDHALSMPFDAHDLGVLRMLAQSHALEAGVGRPAAGDFMMAVNELATNSILHAGGGGTLHLWREPGAVLAEVADEGHIADPQAGLGPPPPESPRGRGLWMVNRICESVQICSSPRGTRVRARVAVRA